MTGGGLRRLGGALRAPWSDEHRFSRTLRHRDGAGPPERWVLRITAANDELFAFDIETPLGRSSIHYRTEDAAMAPTPEAAVTAVFVAACSRGAIIDHDERLDATFVENLHEAAVVLYSWSDGFSLPVLDGPEPRGTEPPPHPGEALLAFTGEIDTTYSASCDPGRAGALLDVTGPDGTRAQAQRSGRPAEVTAALLGLRLVTVRTNIRELTERYASTARHTSGSSFASAGHLQIGGIREVLIPSTDASVIPWGSHFTLDRCWSSSQVRIATHRPEEVRVEKIAHLAQRPALASRTRFCEEGSDAQGNCGRCGSCVRAGLAFGIFGVRQLRGFAVDDVRAEDTADMDLGHVSRRETVHLARAGAAAALDERHQRALAAALERGGESPGTPSPGTSPTSAPRDGPDLGDGDLGRLLRHPRSHGPRERWVVRLTECEPHRFAFDLQTPQRRRTIYFTTGDAPMAPSAEAAVVSVFVAACARGAVIDVDERLDAEFVRNLREAALVLYSWGDGFSMPVLDAPRPAPAPGRRPPEERVVMPFTGGVDSTYSVLHSRDRVGYLLNVIGLDLVPRHPSVDVVRHRLQGLADDLELPLVTVTTNIRKFTKPYASPVHHTHGSIFGAITHLRLGGLQTSLIPSSGAAAVPWGSHFTLDRRWSSSQATVINDGPYLARTEKVAYLSQHPEVVARLKFCSNKISTTVNCGRCAKCVLTSLSFRMFGVHQLLGFTVEDVSPEAVAEMPRDQVSRRTVIHLTRAAEALGFEGPYRRALDEFARPWL